jgi:NitT/TauT family transport system substrate-binding protein
MTRREFGYAGASALVAASGLTRKASAQGPKIWKHGILEAKSDAGFIMMAERGGFAERHGIKIESTQIKNGATLYKALIAGEIDSVEAGAAEAVVAGGRGTDVRIIGCTWPGLPQAVLSRADIKTPADLKGKTIAISAPGSLPELLARGVLDSYKIPVSDVKFANLGADIDRYKAMVSGIADACVVSNEFAAVMPPDYKILVQAREIFPDFIRLCITSTSSALSAKRDEASRFIAAQMEALQFALGHRDEVVKLAREVTGAKADDPRPEFVFDQVVKEKQIDPTLAIPVAKLQWMEELFVKTGNLPQARDVSTFIDADVRAKALTMLGK